MVKQQKFLELIIESYTNVLLSDSSNFNRSSKKVDFLHKQIAHDLNRLFTKYKIGNYIAVTKENYRTEKTCHGIYNDKKADIAILDMDSPTGKVVAAVELKFFLSSIYKNLGNYFEQSIGQCVNLKMANIKYYDVSIFLENTPKFSGNFLSGVDTLDLKHFKSYILRSNLSSSNDPRRISIPNGSLFLAIKNSSPLGNEEKELFFKDELWYLSKQKKDKNIYSEKLLSDSWGENVYINQYDNFILKIVKEISGEK